MLNHGVMGLLPPRSFDLTSMYIKALSQTKQNMNNAGKGLELLLLQNILFVYYGVFVYILIPDFAVEKVDKVLSDLRAAGFDCWKTIVGGPGVGLHFGEPNTNFTIPPALQSRAKLCNIL